jgi:hypothetical protein
MTAKPIALEKARKAKALVQGQLRSLQQLLGVIVLHSGPITLDLEDIETTDPNRLVLVQLHGKVVIGLKDTGDQPLELTAIADRALADASEEPVQ